MGASDETDREIITGMSDLYGRMNFKRVYFSSYQTGLGASDIPGERLFGPDPEQMFLRELCLYQVDFLFRRYGYRAEEIPLQQNGHLSLDKDPKEVWAEMHPAFYPVRINTADREALLRVPGLGPETVKRILKIRRERKITHPTPLRLPGRDKKK